MAQQSRSFSWKSPRTGTMVAAGLALILALVKLVAGFMTGTMMLLASAADSCLDFVVSVFNYFAIRNAEKPSDRYFNYGRGKIKGLASVFEGAMIALSSLLIMFGALKELVQGPSIRAIDIALGVTVFSTLVTALLVVYLSFIIRQTKDLVVVADLLHYKADLWSNLGILAALLMIHYTHWHAADPIFSLIIAAFIFWAAKDLLKEGALMLMDHALEPGLVEGIERILQRSTKIESYHLLKTRRSAEMNFVEVHLVFREGISLMEAHQISVGLEEQIHELRDEKWIFNCHLDPEDDLKRDLLQEP